MLSSGTECDSFCSCDLDLLRVSRISSSLRSIPGSVVPSVVFNADNSVAYASRNPEKSECLKTMALNVPLHSKCFFFAKRRIDPLRILSQAAQRQRSRSSVATAAAAAVCVEGQLPISQTTGLVVSAHPSPPPNQGGENGLSAAMSQDTTAADTAFGQRWLLREPKLRPKETPASSLLRHHTSHSAQLRAVTT